jgi:hypothetical protein
LADSVVTGRDSVVETEMLPITRRRWHFITGVIVVYSTFSAAMLFVRMYVQ